MAGNERHLKQHMPQQSPTIANCPLAAHSWPHISAKYLIGCIFCGGAKLRIRPEGHKLRNEFCINPVNFDPQASATRESFDLSWLPYPCSLPSDPCSDLAT
jgi:hypothetical protein